MKITYSTIVKKYTFMVFNNQYEIFK